MPASVADKCQCGHVNTGHRLGWLECNRPGCTCGKFNSCVVELTFRVSGHTEEFLVLHGVIQSPDKFEGEPLWVPLAYEICQDFEISHTNEDWGSGEWAGTVSEDIREEWALDEDAFAVHISQSSNGFVSGSTMNQQEWEQALEAYQSEDEEEGGEEDEVGVIIGMDAVGMDAEVSEYIYLNRPSKYGGDESRVEDIPKFPRQFPAFDGNYWSKTVAQFEARRLMDGTLFEITDLESEKIHDEPHFHIIVNVDTVENSATNTYKERYTTPESARLERDFLRRTHEQTYGPDKVNVGLMRCSSERCSYPA